MSNKAYKIREMLLNGQRYPEIIKELNVASSTIAYHARQLGLSKFTFERRTYDWEAIQSYYDEGYLFADLTRKFGVNSGSIYEAAKRGQFRIADSNSNYRKQALRRTQIQRQRPLRFDINLFVENSIHGTAVVRRAVKKLGLMLYVCSNPACLLHTVENPTWAGSDLVLHLDHINGKRNDHRLSNLRWLCPNCHSQTKTYCGRNLKKCVDEHEKSG